MAGIVIAGLAAKFVFGNPANLSLAMRIETPGLGAEHRQTRTLPVGEEVTGLLGTKLVLLVHVGEDPDRRFGKLLAAKAEDANDHECDQSVG